MTGESPEDLLFLCALQNSVKHGGVPQAGAVIGMVMSAHPELRSQAKEVASVISNALNAEAVPLVGEDMKKCFEWEFAIPPTRGDLEDAVF